MNPNTTQGTYFCLNRLDQKREFILLPSGAIYDIASNSLICADLHLGKSQHFRSRGIATPLAVDKATLVKLEKDIQVTCPENIYFLGDLFHSSYNAAVDIFQKLVEANTSCSFNLIPGNHDILNSEVYKTMGINVLTKVYPFAWLNFVHKPSFTDSETIFEISGHLHPGVLLVSKARQFNRLPCFYWSRNYAVLPSYGVFTGLSTIQPAIGDEVFVIFDGKVVKFE